METSFIEVDLNQFDVSDRIATWRETGSTDWNIATPETRKRGLLAEMAFASKFPQCEYHNKSTYDFYDPNTTATIEVKSIGIGHITTDTHVGLMKNQIDYCRAHYVYVVVVHPNCEKGWICGYIETKRAKSLPVVYKGESFHNKFICKSDTYDLRLGNLSL